MMNSSKIDKKFAQTFKSDRNSFSASFSTHFVHGFVNIYIHQHLHVQRDFCVAAFGTENSWVNDKWRWLLAQN